MNVTTEARVQISSTELGTLWMAYQIISANIQLFGTLQNKAIDKEAKDILASYVAVGQTVKKDEIEAIFNSEGAVIPKGFVENDVMREAPALYDDIFSIMLLRQMMKLRMGHCAVFLATSYKKEVHDVFKHITLVSDEYYTKTTNYLLAKGVLPQPPIAVMPIQTLFIQDKSYMGGNPFTKKRPVNTIEVGYINEAIDSNILGMQFITGFSQVAKESDIKQFFIEGKELSKKIIAELSAVLSDSDVQPPSTWTGKATGSTTAPFSDRIMLFFIRLLSSTALGFNALGTSFSMRADLHIKFASIAKDTFDFLEKGQLLSIKYHWLEQPPDMK